MVQENVHFGPLIGTFVFSRQNLFCAFWKMGEIKPCPLNFHSHQASGGGMVITFNTGRARAGSQRGDCQETAAMSKCRCAEMGRNGLGGVRLMPLRTEVPMDPAEADTRIRGFQEINAAFISLNSV